jgi:hypothetical protein
MEKSAVLLWYQRRQRNLQKEKKIICLGSVPQISRLSQLREEHESCLNRGRFVFFTNKKNCTRNSLKVFTGTERKIEIKKNAKTNIEKLLTSKKTNARKIQRDTWRRPWSPNPKANEQKKTL